VLRTHKVNAAMTIATDRRMTLEEYLDYDDGTNVRYELVDGVLVEMGAESTLNTQIAMFLIATFLRMGIPYNHLGIKQQIAVSSQRATSRDPDLTVHSEASALAISGLKQALLMPGMPAPMLVVEVVSNSDTDRRSRDRDYTEKFAEYAERGIPEYWIVDPAAGLVTVCTLDEAVYQVTEFIEDEAVFSPTFPALKLTAAQILAAGM
jgi:Uma2 family endonuclease